MQVGWNTLGSVLCAAIVSAVTCPASRAADKARIDTSPLARAADALQRAVMTGDVVAVRGAAPAASGVAIYDAYGYTPLIWACAQRSPAVAAVLVQQGQDPGLPSPTTGWTPLMMAALFGNLGTVRLLLAAGADPSQTAVDGSTAASVARGKQNTALAELIEQAASARRSTPSATTRATP